MRTKPLARPLVVAACAALLAAPVHAGEPARPPVLKALETQGLTVIQEFNVADGLRGFAGAIQERPVAIYVTPDGTAIVGTRVDVEGRPIDAATLQDLVAKPMGKKIWSQLSESSWVLDGRSEAPRIVYTFSDANCPYCHQFWEASRPWVEAGKVQLRHILVGVIRDDSPAKAAAILRAPDPSAALQKNEQRFDQGGIEPASEVPDDVLEVLARNQMLMVSTGFRGTPGIVVREEDGTVKKFRGMPQGDQLNEVLGPR